MPLKNAAIIGCGAIFSMHAEAVNSSPHARLYAVCDIKPELANEKANEYSCRAYTDYNSVLADENVDTVHICTPHYLHVPMMLAAANAGKSIVVEKPAAMNFSEFSAAQEKLINTPVCAILQNRYQPCIKMLKTIIDSKKYGAVLGAKGFITWKRTAEYYASGAWRGRLAAEGGGLVINQCLHTLDLLCFLCGKPQYIKSSCDRRVLNIEAEDTAEAVIFLENGVIAHFYGTNNYSTNSAYDIEVHTENAVLRYMYNRLFLIENESMTELCSNGAPKTGEKAYWGSCHGEAIGRFYAAQSGEKCSYTTLLDAAMSVALVDGLYRSARLGEKVKIEF